MHGPDQGVALYFADQLGRFVAVPFGDNTAIVEAFEDKLDDLMEVYEDVMRETIFQDIDEATRWKIVKARIRNGKIERRRKVSSLDGFTFRKKGGSVVFMRIPVTERIRRKRGARKAKIKKRGKLNQMKLRQKRSRFKRRSIGI